MLSKYELLFRALVEVQARKALCTKVMGVTFLMSWCDTMHRLSHDAMLH